MSKLISTFKIGFDDETKAEISELKNKLDEVNKSLNARDGGFWLEAKRNSNSRIGQIIAADVSNQIKEMSHPDGLLKAMQAEAANDAPEPELKQMGQWVFEGRDKKWASAHVDQDGQGFLCTVPKSMTVRADGYWTTKYVGWRVRILDGKFDASDWESSVIDREIINDVDYLSESVSEIQGMKASDIIIDDMGRDYSHNSNCLSAVVPQITQADMQLIFIKNLSDVLIQRMHSMYRFSDDGRSIVCNEFKAWDIVVNKANDNPHYAVVCGFGVINSDEIAQKISLIKVTPWDSRDGHCQGGDWMIFGQQSSWRTITEVELPAFRDALEACYA